MAPRQVGVLVYPMRGHISLIWEEYRSTTHQNRPHMPMLERRVCTADQVSFPPPQSRFNSLGMTAYLNTSTVLVSNLLLFGTFLK
jgi:hypothetical protein